MTFGQLDRRSKASSLRRNVNEHRKSAAKMPIAKGQVYVLIQRLTATTTGGIRSHCSEACFVPHELDSRVRPVSTSRRTRTLLDSQQPQILADHPVSFKLASRRQNASTSTNGTPFSASNGGSEKTARPPRWCLATNDLEYASPHSLPSATTGPAPRAGAIELFLFKMAESKTLKIRKFSPQRKKCRQGAEYLTALITLICLLAITRTRQCYIAGPLRQLA